MERLLLLTPSDHCLIPGAFFQWPSAWGTELSLSGHVRPATHILFTGRKADMRKTSLLFLQAASNSTILVWLVVLVLPFPLGRILVDQNGKRAPRQPLPLQLLL